MYCYCTCSVVGVVKSSEILTICYTHVVAEQVAHAPAVSVVPFKALILDNQFFEPGSTRQK